MRTPQVSGSWWANDRADYIRRMKPLLLLMFIPLLTACGGGDTVEQKEQAEQEPAVHTIDLAPYDMPLVVEIDPNVVAVDTPQVRWSEEFGRLEVEAGGRFNITIREEEADLERLKADLERDMLRKSTILEETPEMVIYRTEYPDDTIVFIHFQRVVTSEGRSFIVESHEQGRFSEQDVRRMANSVHPAQRV